MIIFCVIVFLYCGWFWLPHAVPFQPFRIVLQAEGFVGSTFDVARRCRWHTGRAGFAVVGPEYLYSRLLQLLGKNAKFGVENPGYRKITKLYEVGGVAWDYVDIDGQGMKV